MGIEIGIWRIDKDLTPVDYSKLDLESRLQEILCNDISIADPNLMVIGREVRTTFGKRVDILAINRDGHLAVIELKRDKTPREVVAQILEYGAWVRDLDNEAVAQIYTEYQKQYPKEAGDGSIDEQFCSRFNVGQMPDELNESHQLIVVASELDSQTERIVTYLAEEHGVNINAVFFRVFKDGDREYLTRAWLRDPASVDTGESEGRAARKKGEWNGEFYGSFGHGGGNEGRIWEEAVKYGYFSAGGGEWYTKTLSMLEPGARIWANVPGAGYVGVGQVVETAVPVDDFLVVDPSGKKVPIQSLPIAAAKMWRYADDPDKAEYLVRVKWLKTVSVEEPIKEKGLFGNQNSVARPVAASWDHTVERLKKRFGIS